MSGTSVSRAYPLSFATKHPAVGRRRRAVAALVLLMSAACSSTDDHLAVALVTPVPDVRATRASTLAHVYALAKVRDAGALLALQGEKSPLPSASPSDDPAIALALYTIDAKTYGRSFVDRYPGSRDTLMVDYGSAFQAAHVEPHGALFPIQSLGAFALAGDGDAYVKLLGALPVTDGSIGDAYRAQARAVMTKRPVDATIDAFAALPPAPRLGAVASVNWCRQSPAAILAFRPTPTPSPAASESASASPAPSASPSSSPTPSPRPTRTPPSRASVEHLQAAIAHAAQVDCALARPRVTARTHTANPKTRGAATHTR